jgi:hypothetical protein
MATQVQINANRKNAQRSTGPRTPEGKASAAQNSIKHGLSARHAVIASESHAEFATHRDNWLAELAPESLTESLLASRIITLSWRLKRVERVQNQAINYITAHEINPLVNITQSVVKSLISPEGPHGPAPHDSDLKVACAFVKDFYNEKSLDRLLMYERRIENSLQKALRHLQQQQQARQNTPATEAPKTTEKPNKIMQNEPNFKTPEKPLNQVPKTTYENNTTQTPNKNEPNTNPIRTQFPSNVGCDISHQ